jgi:hypothetical protein
MHRGKQHLFFWADNGAMRQILLEGGYSSGPDNNGSGDLPEKPFRSIVPEQAHSH